MGSLPLSRDKEVKEARSPLLPSREYVLCEFARAREMLQECDILEVKGRTNLRSTKNNIE
jgi:hypothetical protein